MKNHSTKQILIVLSVVILILLGLHLVIFRFIQKADREVATLEGEVVSLKSQVTEFSKYNPDELRNLAQSVISRLVSKADFVDFIETIEKEGKAHNLSVVTRSVNVEPRSEDVDDDKEIIRLRLETVGSWSDTMGFVNYLEHLPYKTVLQSLSLSVVAPVEPVPITQWQGQIEITALKLK